MNKLKLFFKTPKSLIVRLWKLSKIFGLLQSLISLLPLFKKPLNPTKVVASAWSSELQRYIFFRPATSDIGILQQVFIDRDYEYDLGFTPDLLVDGGAHCGFASLYFLNKFPDMNVIAIEPEESNFSILKKNLRSNENVKLINKPLASKSKSLSLSNPHAKNPSFQYAEHKSGSGQEATTIMQILDKYKNSYEYSILKLDIEGAEKEIFNDNPEDLFDKFDTIFVEPHDWIYPNTEEIIVSLARENKKEIEWIGENIVLN